MATPESPISISWPATLPVPTNDQESAISRALLPASRDRWKTEPPRFTDLPPRRQAEVVAAAASHGLHVGQACSLRKEILRSFAPWKFHGGEAEERARATEFEDAVGRYLRSFGVVVLSESEQAAETRSKGLSTTGQATPDFIVRSELVINGRPVRWVEVKRFYGTGVAGLRAWQPSRKAPEQLERYRNTYGPGAVVLLYGYATGFRARVHEDVLLLDAGPFMESVLLAASRGEEDGRASALGAGAPSSTPHKPVSITSSGSDSLAAAVSALERASDLIQAGWRRATLTVTHVAEVDACLDEARTALLLLWGSPASSDPELKGTLIRLRVHWELRSADLARLRADRAFASEAFLAVSAAITDALERVEAAHRRLDEALAWQEEGTVAVPPHMAPLAAEQGNLSGWAEQLAADVRGYQQRVAKFIANTERAMQSLVDGRARVRSKVGEKAWTSNSSRPDWTPSNPAEQLAALTQRLRELQGLQGVLQEAERALARTARGGGAGSSSSRGGTHL